MPPKAKDAKKGLYKQGTLLKDIIPATVKQPPLEGRPIRIPEYAPTQQQINPYEPQPDFEDWPGDEAAANFDFGVDVQSGKAYVDPVKFSVPPSFKSNENQIIFWRRPKELVKTELTEGPMSVTSLKTVDKHFQRAGTTVEGELSEGRRSIFHEDTVFDKDDLEISLFDVYEREETAEEVTQRLKEIAEKAQQAKKKPAGKKEEVVDTNPQKIKDVRLSNINMREDVPAYAKWIASQLQVIKDRNIRDINSKKPIWTKVYPQKDGVPVFNPSGRYWVKLYYMGKEKKIDIDDRIPVIYGRSLFAKSVQESEIWPFIFTKALIKLNAARWNDESAKEIEVGDGSIMYALTGYVPETISLSQNYQEKLKIISSALNDRNYNTGDRYITCFCLPNHKPSLAANKVAKDTSIDSKQGKPSSKKERDSPRNQSSDSRGNSQDPDKSPGLGGPPKRREQHSSTTMSKSPRPDPIQTRKDDILREKVTNVIPGFAYSVVDLFENEGFNMVYALERTENDIKLRTDLQALNKVNTNKLTKEEKIEHRRQKKELASKITAEDNKRMELIKTPARRYRLFKLRSGVGKTSALNFDCAFSDKDITVAKTCILNKLSKPPNYDLYDVKMDDKSVTSSQVVVESQKILPLDDFSKIDNLREPLKRGTAGSWLLNEDLDRYFQYIQIFHDPTRFKYKETFLLPARADEELVSYDDKEVIVLEGDEEEKEEEKERDRDTTFQPFLYSFASSRAANMTIELKPALCLQKFDFQNFEIAYSYKTLNQPHDSDCLVLGNKNQVFRMQIVSPLSCYLWIAANLHFKLMSMADFLCTYEGYQLRNQPIDYPIIEKNRYHLFYKGIINPLNETTNLICRLKNSTDLAMLRSVRIKLVELTNKTYKSEEDFSTGVVTLPLEQSFYAGKSMLTLESQKKYMLVVEGRMAETTNEGTMELDILFRAPDFTLETVEQVEPLEYMDKYFPTKYGVLFRERLFLNNEAQASFFVRISDVLGQSAQQTAQKGKKGDVPQVEEKDLTAMRTVKLELFRDNELVSFAFGQNKAVLSNVGLYPTNNKDEPRNYFLQASLDIREWPECKEENEQTSNLHWILKVHSSDTIAIFKDTFKEDNIKAIKKSWEDKEPGRADKAKTARKKFLILEKIKRGEHVEADELQLINEPRQRKNKEEEAKKDPKGKTQPKGKAPPPGKPGKKEEAPVEEKKEERPLPKSKDHVMNELCKFLTHMEQPRLLQEGTEDDEVAVRTEEERNELREKILLGREEAYGMHDRNKRAREKIKEILGNKKEQIQKDYKAAREDAKEKLVSLMKEREEFRKKDKDLKDKERTLIALCKQEKPVYDEVVKFITENAEQVDPALIKLLGKVKKNAYIQDKITRLTEAMTAYDITTITTLMDEIRAEEIDIDEKLYNDAEELIDMAEKNPTFIADKQKEAQKAAKGKKK